MTFHCSSDNKCQHEPCMLLYDSGTTSTGHFALSHRAAWPKMLKDPQIWPHGHRRSSDTQTACHSSQQHHCVAGQQKRRNTKQKMKNWAKKGHGLGDVTYFWILGPPLSLVTMKLQTSNFAAGSMVRNTKQKMKNWAKKGRGLGHVTYFWIVGPPINLQLGWSYKKDHKRRYYFAAQWHFGNVLRCNTIFCDFCCFLRMIKN